MIIIKKAVYILSVLSLLPILVTYFAYGSARDMCFFFITLLWVVGLVWLTIKLSKTISTIALLLGLAVVYDQIIGLKVFYINNGEGDPLVTFAFTLQAVLLVVALLFIYQDRRKMI